MPTASPSASVHMIADWRDIHGVFVVDKPSGMLVHNSAWAGPKEHTLVDEVRQITSGYHPVHRLDRGASGIVLFAHDVATWQRHLATSDKRYLALVRGHVAQAVTVDHPVRDEEGKVHDARSDVTPVLVSDRARASLVSVKTYTGRHHQVRRHLKHISHPILGDATHGKGPLNREYAQRFGLSRLALHAWRLSVGGLDVEAPPLGLWPVLTQLFDEDALLTALANRPLIASLPA